MTIYAVQRSDGLIKIGYSGNVPTRYYELCIIHRQILKPIGLISGERKKERKIQRLLHQSAADEKEWFHPTPVVLAAVAMFGHWPAAEARKPRRGNAVGENAA